MMTNPKKAMLFAAGLGTRLRPLTLTTPKPLIDVGGEPLISYSLKKLKAAGVSEVMVNTHYLPEQIESVLGDGRAYGLTIHYSREERLLGTGGGLLNVAEFFRDESAFWVMNSDTLLDVDLNRVVDVHAGSSARATLVTHLRKPEFGGVFVNMATSRILSFFKSPSDQDAREMDFCGVSLQTPMIFSYLEKANSHTMAPCLIRDGLVPMLHDGHCLMAHSVSGYFNDVGTLDRLATARADL